MSKIFRRRTTWTRSAIRTLTVVACAVWFGGSARAEPRLFEQVPYDLIVLTKGTGGDEIKVRPLAERPLAESPPARSKLVVRRVEDPDKSYEIAWASIDREKTRLFEELVLDKANELVRAKQFEEAYDYFDFLQRQAYRPAALERAFQDYLYAEAGVLHRQGKSDVALARLRELYDLAPRRPNLDKALGLATDKLVSLYRNRKDYQSARKLLVNLAAQFPESPVVAKHRNELQREAAALLNKARAATRKRDFGEAIRLTNDLVRIWPDVPGAREFSQELHAKHPRVVVGVCTPAPKFGESAGPKPGQLNGWAQRRGRRLLYRTLTEFAGMGTEGGNYHCPVGELDVEELEGRLWLTIRQDVGWSSGDALLTGYDVSRRLLAMTQPDDPSYRVDWAELFAGVEVSDVYKVSIALHRPHVRPDALLQTMLVPYTTQAASAGAAPFNGPYVEDLRADQTVHYLPNAQYFAATEGQPGEIVERRFDQGARAIEALRDGRVDVLDRVYPWNIEAEGELLSLKNSMPGEKLPGQRLLVGQYRLPLVHCLVPNLNKPLTARRTFRRALVYAIHRQAILDSLTDAGELPGCRVVSGPFPPGTSSSDPIGYANDSNIQPRNYDPRLAVALATIALRNLVKEKTDEAESLDKMPELVLAYPRDEIAEVACTSIKQQLELINIPVKLQPLSGPAPARIPPEVDLLYAELAMWEPVVDARRLLGENGMAAGCSPYMSLALRQLEEAADWQRVSAVLRGIHRIAHHDLAVIPLWQLPDFFAYHESLEGIGGRPISLYQNIEQWKLAFRYPGDQE